MGFSDDEYYDDDVYYDDDDDVNDPLDDDEDVGSSRSTSNPFSKRSSGLPGSGRSSSSFGGRSSSSGGDSGRGSSSSKRSGSSGGSSFGRGGGDKKSDTGPLRSSFGRGGGDRKDDPSSKSSGARFGGGGSGSTSSFGRGRDDKKDDSSSKSSGARFGGGGSGSTSSFGRGGDKKDDSGAKKSGFGGFGRGDDKKDDSGAKKSGFGGFGRGGDKKDDSGAKKSGFGGFGRGGDKKDDSSAKKSGFGGFGRGGDKKDDSSAKKSGFGGFGRGGDKKDDSGARKSSFGRGGGDDKKSGAGGGLLGGITGMFNRGGGDKKDDRRTDSGTGRSGGLGRGDDSRGGGSQQRSTFGSRSSGGDSGGRQGGKGDSQARGKSAEGGGFFNRINPFGGGTGETKQRTSKTRASKIPKTAGSGFQLDLDAKLDIAGVVLVFGGLILFISSLSADQGSVTGWFNDIFVSVFGWGALAGPVAMFAIGVWLIVRHFGDEAPEVDLVRVTGILLLYLAVLMTMMFIETFSDVYSAAFSRSDLLLFINNSVEAGRGGGAVGAGMYKLMIQNVGEIGAVFAILGWYVIGIMLATRTSAAEITVFVISVWRSFQIAMQRRAQRRRAQRLVQSEAQQAAQLSVSRPAAAALSSGASGALPAPGEGVPIEDRPIPIRMGGQMISSRQEEEVEAQPPAAIAAPPASVPEAGSGKLLGGIAARLRKATPFGSGNGDNTSEEIPAEKSGDQADTSSGGLGAAAASAVGSVATLGGLLGSRGNGGEREQAEMPAPLAPSQPVKPPQPSSLPPVPDRTQQTDLFGRDKKQTPAPDAESPFRRAAPPAGEPRTTAQPAAPAAPVAQEAVPSPSRFGVRPAATVAPAPAIGEDVAPEDALTARPRPSGSPFGTKPSSSGDSTATPPRTGAGALSGRPSGLRPQTVDAGDEDETGEDTAAQISSQPGQTGPDRMSRLGQIRAGQTASPLKPVITEDDLDDEDEDADGVVTAAASAENPFAPSTSKPSRFRFDAQDEEDEDFGLDDLLGGDDDFDLDDLLDEDEDDDEEEEKIVAAEPAAPRSFGGLSPAKTFTPPTAVAGTPARVPEPAPRSADKQPAASVQTQVTAPPQPAAPAPDPVINPVRPRPQVQPVSVSGSQRQWRLPDYRTLLASGSDQEFDRDGLVRRARIIEETLLSFGAPGRVVEINTGPVITQFGVEPDYLTARGGKKNRVKVSAIAALDKDLQLALGAKSIRVEAPVPGKGYVGIEVPNEEASLVSLRDVMESREFTRITSPLAIALGMSVDGSPVAADLTSMPHLLIAGTTGSGKSVCVNSIITSLLIRNTPETVKFIMVDPKRVELTSYNHLPHLVAPVVVELERIVGVLKWVTREMDERYKRFSGAGARNIVDYNNNLPAGAELMPYIVVIVDELADLMMLAPDETERVITRIAALARATGIHLVIATQRPSVDVVTGLIKANFPARIAFAVAGGVDSRVILDQPGAERLLGKGDMLYMSPDSPAPLRLQGVFVSDMEIGNIARFWKGQDTGATQQKPITSLFMDDSASPQGRAVIPRGERFMQQPPPSTQGQRAFWDETSPANPDVHSAGYGMSEREKQQDDERDELYGESVELVRRLSKASVSLLQRRLRIGYTRAARLIDIMEAEGIVGPPTEGSKPREVLPEKK